MNIDGTYTLQAPPEEVWNLLMDLQTIRRTIQGMERLERTEEDTYTFTLHITHAPLRGSYSGNAVATKMEYPYSYHMRAEGKGIAGIFQAEWNMTLTPHDEYTVVIYQGTLLFSIAHTQLPSPLVKGTIKVLIQQFFTTLADHLRSTSHWYPNHSEAHNTQIEVSPVQNERIEFSPVHNKPSFLHSVVRQLGLGVNDPFLEQLWVNRLRRIGIVSMLLILVWVGTRLPRRSGDRQGR
jgi:carbon monoxide dehydrogenase subunit G